MWSTGNLSRVYSCLLPDVCWDRFQHPSELLSLLSVVVMNDVLHACRKFILEEKIAFMKIGSIPQDYLISVLQIIILTVAILGHFNV